MGTGGKAPNPTCRGPRSEPDSPRAFWRERLRPVLSDFEWPVVFALAVLAAILGLLGYAQQFSRAGVDRSFWDILYDGIGLFIMQAAEPVEPPVNCMLNIARFLAPAVAGYTVLKAFMALFAGQLQSFRLRLLRGHVVVCGLGRKGMSLARGFLARGERVVAIEQDEENDFIRQCRDLGAIVLVGDMASPLLLRRAGVQRARYLFAVSGDDGANAEVAVNACGLVPSGRASRPLTCAVHIFDPQLCLLLRERELAALGPKGSRLEFFNTFDLGARILLGEHPATDPDGAAGARIGQMIVVGVGQLGESLIVTAARQWHARRGPEGPRLRVTLVDLNATQIAKSLSVHYPSLARACELVPRDMDVRSPEFHQATFLTEACAQGAANVYVCLDDDSFSLSTALALVQPLREQEPTVVVRMTEEAGLATLLRDVEEGSFRHLRSFGLLDRTCRPELVLHGTHEIIARAIHDEYRRQRKAAGETPETNPSIVPWDDLSERLKESNRQQAAHLGVKLKAVGCAIALLTDWDEPPFAFRPDEVEALARMEHERWKEELERAGWRHGPPPKDPVKKTHPCLVPYDQLPDGEKEKDRNTVREIPRFLAQVGFRVYRVKQA